ncbi:hypothetical protein CVD27_12315 [Neobacillus cucumis]|uniref:Uncharacterized protein n=1 Tax=Neobacillus cucumis TaxID=1740721 RepID=A0A2N5HFG9_9BACI|nr:hypothetical protein CVD27_12315 [Neobacillus cucumis]
MGTVLLLPKRNHKNRPHASFTSDIIRIGEVLSHHLKSLKDVAYPHSPLVETGVLWEPVHFGFNSHL